MASARHPEEERVSAVFWFSSPPDCVLITRKYQYSALRRRPGGAYFLIHDPVAAVRFPPLAPRGRGVGGEGCVYWLQAQCNPFPRPHPLAPPGRGGGSEGGVCIGCRRNAI